MPRWGIPYFNIAGIEPIEKQMSGGHLLPPVQKLVATIIFALGENANRFRSAAPTKKPNLSIGQIRLF